MTLFRASLLVVLASLGGCQSYEPSPLSLTPRLEADVSKLAEAPSGPLTLPVLDRLVLRSNPELIATRAKLGVSEAQVLQAGLLPNPQFSASYPFYISGPNGSDGFTLSVAQDLRSLLLRPARREAATNAASAVNASLLWQEWQTIGKARLLFVDIAAGECVATLIGRNRKLLQERFDIANAQIRGGGGPLSNLTPDLVALGDVQKSADDLARQQLVRRHQLAALLGLAPDAPLRLAAPRAVPSLDTARVRGDIAGLANRRPDLVALQYGYRSQDARLRQAVLGQFPNLTVGLLGGRDNSFVYSTGPQASIDVPIFDRGEVAVAAEQATREQLKEEFEARLAQAAGEIGALVSEQTMLRKQLTALDARLKQSRDIAAKTEAAFKTGALDERSYVDVEVSLLSQEQQKLSLDRALQDGQVALATLSGAGMPAVAIGPEPPPADPVGLLRVLSR